jgi:hypothetical protein
VRSRDHKAPRHVVFSTPVVFCCSCRHVILSTLLSKTLSLSSFLNVRNATPEDDLLKAQCMILVTVVVLVAKPSASNELQFSCPGLCKSARTDYVT